MKIGYNFKYFYDQLDANGQKFYQILEKMYVENKFEEATEDYSIIDNEYGFSQEEVNGFLYGSTTLLDTFRAALDAFSFDYNNVFYVDFDKLSLKFLTKNGNVVGLIGPGNFDNYLIDGISSSELSSKVTEYESKIIKIFNESAIKGNLTDQIKEAYKQIISGME